MSIEYCDVKTHYDALVDEGNDPVYDGEELRRYMDRWDGETFLEKLALGHTRNKDVFEIGVGTGRLAVRTAPLSRSFTGIDLSPKSVKRAGENLVNFAGVTDAVLICGDFLSYETDAEYDVVYSSLTFMHIEDKKAAISAAAKLVRPGGRFVLSISKSTELFLKYGDRTLSLYPDSLAATLSFMRAAGLSVSVTGTENAHITVGEKKRVESGE